MKSFLHFAAKHASLNIHSEYDTLRCMCCKCLSQFVSHLESKGPTLTDSEREFARATGQQFLDSLTLRIEWNEHQSDYYWSCRPTTHSFQCGNIRHLQTSRMNPLYQWSCWMEETLMGTTATITKRCHMNTMLLRSIQRYALKLSVQLYGSV